jgi:hypothetical protein
MVAIGSGGSHFCAGAANGLAMAVPYVTVLPSLGPGHIGIEVRWGVIT